MNLWLWQNLHHKSVVIKAIINEDEPGPWSDLENETALEGRNSFLAVLSLCSFESDALSSSSIVTAMSLGCSPESYNRPNRRPLPTWRILLSSHRGRDVCTNWKSVLDWPLQPPATSAITYFNLTYIWGPRLSATHPRASPPGTCMNDVTLRYLHRKLRSVRTYTRKLMSLHYSYPL